MSNWAEERAASYHDLIERLEPCLTDPNATWWHGWDDQDYPASKWEEMHGGEPLSAHITFLKLARTYFRFEAEKLKKQSEVTQ